MFDRHLLVYQLKLFALLLLKFWAVVNKAARIASVYKYSSSDLHMFIWLLGCLKQAHYSLWLYHIYIYIRPSQFCFLFVHCLSDLVGVQYIMRDWAHCFHLSSTVDLWVLLAPRVWGGPRIFILATSKPP